MSDFSNFKFPAILAITLAVSIIPAVRGQSSSKGEFLLPSLSRGDPPKPTISPELAHYFVLPDGGARRFVNTLVPGLVPPPTFEVAGDPQQQQISSAIKSAAPQINSLLAGGNPFLQLQQSGALNGASGNLANSALQALLGTGPSNSAQAWAPGISVRPAFKISANDTGDDNDTASQISGIPRIFPTLPRAPVAQPSPVVFPSLPTRPAVPEGGLGPLASLTSSSSSFGSGLSAQAPGSPFLPGSGLQAAVPNVPSLSSSLIAPQQSAVSSLYPQPNAGNENLIAQLLRTFGLNGLAPNLDLSAVNSVLGLNPQAPNVNPNPGLVSNVVYSALADGKVQTSQAPGSVASIEKGPLSALGNASELINNKANAALIQNLLTQPNSPFCNPKPQPVETFNIDAFMGKWYQVLYSPPLSAGPCSMVTYQKLADVGQGGPGTVFNTFEYSTEATPYGKPKVSSGYGIVRGPGQMIYRTTNSPSDVNVYVLETGPTNELGQYDYAILAVNCNYPLHVFARDPIQYKQKYEAEVNSALEQRSLVTSWSRLLNLVAPVDSNLCTFPPTLFNVKG